MNIEKTRSIIALTVIAAFLIISGVIAVMPLFGDTDLTLKGYTDYFLKISSVYTGIIGVIIGYYFAKSSQKEEK